LTGPQFNASEFGRSASRGGFAADRPAGAVVPQPATSGYVSVRDFGATGDGTTADAPALRDAAAAAATRGCGLLLPCARGHAYVVGSAVSIAAAVPVVIEAGAVLAPRRGVTVRLDGPVSAGHYKVFGGAGTVQLSARTTPTRVVRWWGAVGDGTTDDTAAFRRALAAGSPLAVPAGTYVVRGLDVAGARLTGDGRGATVLTAPTGDVLVNAVGVALERLSIRQPSFVAGGGRLVSVPNGGDTGASTFNEVDFKGGTHHVHADRVCVDWSFERCVFNEAATCSRFFRSAWAYKEFNCYTWYNGVGLQIEGGASINVYGSVFEYNARQAVVLRAADAAHELSQVQFNGVHFESNATASRAEAVLIEVASATRVRSIAFNSCAFYAPQGREFVRAAASGGGNIARVSFRDVYARGNLINAGAVGSLVLDNVEFNQGSAPRDAIVR
jgi:hypothetical protein